MRKVIISALHKNLEEPQEITRQSSDSVKTYEGRTIPCLSVEDHHFQQCNCFEDQDDLEFAELVF